MIDKSCCVKREKDDIVDKRYTSLKKVSNLEVYSKTGMRVETPSNCRSEIDSPTSRKSMNTMNKLFKQENG